MGESAQAKKRKVTIVIGAGVSMDCKFPSGQDLKVRVVNQLRRQSQRPEADRLANSAVRSIDEHLKNHPEEAMYIKPIIQDILMRLEAENQISNNFLNPRGCAFGVLLEKLERFEGWHDLVVVNFNYDRNLQYYFFTALKNRSKASDAEVWKKIYAAKVLHVYGRLPSLPGEANFIEILRKKEFRYGFAPANPNSIEAEELAGHADACIASGGNPFVTRKDLAPIWEESAAILFLGFGYGQENMEVLGLDRKGLDVTILGTGLDLERDDSQRVEKDLGFKPLDMSSTDLLKEFPFEDYWGKEQ
ncbi:MAG: hypothetical protein AB7F86_02620 [Bdellovibrionales bacterium]